MKKRVIIFSTIIFIIAIIVAIYVKKNKEELPTSFSAHAGFIFSPEGSASNHPAGGEVRIFKGYVNRVEIDAKIETGGLIFTVSAYNHDDNVIGEMIFTDTITASTTYEYDMNSLPVGSYWIEIAGMDKNTKAEGQYYHYSEKK